MVKRKFKNSIRKHRLAEFPARLARQLKIRWSRGHLEAKSAEFKALFPANAKINRLAGGFIFTEGPIWFAESI